MLTNKHILLGVTGSIAAYKSVDLVRRLTDAGAIVRVVMTENAKRFITPLTLQVVSGFPIHDDLFDPAAEAAMGHIELARWADLIVVAPASADLIARLAHGHASDLLTTLCLATKAPIAILPAMNQGMWQHALTQANVKILTEQGVHFLGPDVGIQACGDVGPGRMLEPEVAIEKINVLFKDNLFKDNLFSGVKVLVTAGPTHEPIDPIRYVTNGSTGKMGYALAEAAQRAGATVTLVSGPVALQKIPNIDTIYTKTAQEMNDEVMKNIAKYDIFLAVAAVGDYRAEVISLQKIHKHDDALQLNFKRNPDIVMNVSALPSKPFIVGFAAETEKIVENARAKFKRKKMDMLIANEAVAGMGADDNAVTVITPHTEIEIPRLAKNTLAAELIKLIAKEFRSKAC